MKRKLSLLLALLMVLTLVPVTPSFAASKNSIYGRANARDDADLYESFGKDAPKLLIKEDGDFEAEEEFEVQLLGDDAKWVDDYLKKVTYDETTMSIEWKSSKTLKVKMFGFDKKEMEDKKIEIPMFVKFDGAEGEQKVRVKSTGAVTNGEYTYATVSDGDISMTLEDKVKISRSSDDNEITLKFEETTPKSFAEQGKDGVVLRLPKDFEFEKVADSKNPDVDLKVSGDDNRELEITFKDPSPTENNTIWVTFKVNPKRKAPFGDVDVTVRKGDISPSSIVVAEHVDYDVDVKVEKVLDVLAGRDISKEYVSKITLDPKVDNAILKNRYIEFSFVDKDGNLADASVQNSEQIKTTGVTGLDIDEVGDYTDESKDDYLVREFEIATKSRDLNNKFTVEVPFVVASDYEGELFIKVEGAGVQEQIVKIADVKAPVTFEVAKQLSQVKVGLQYQDAADITVTEVQAGALQDYTEGLGNKQSSKSVTYRFVPEDDEYFKFKDFDVKVEKGNISYDEKKTDISDDDRAIEFVVDRKSTEASTIKFSNIKVTLDRTVPYGGMKLKAQFGVVDNRHDLTNNTKKLDYFVTVTPVDDVKRLITVFTLGEKSYSEKSGTSVNTQSMDVAPYAKSGSTMLPIRYVGNAIGARTEWNQSTSEVTITKDNTVVSINIYSDTMYVNGSPVKMSQKPDILENRTFLPLKSVAQAFGLQTDVSIFYHEGKGTVTILPQDASQAEIDAAKAGTILD